MRHRRPAKANRKAKRKQLAMPIALLLVLFTQASTALADSNVPPPPSPAAPIGEPSAPAAPALATHDLPTTAPEQHRGFYESGWFWAAVGAAAFVGGAVFLATRDSTPSTIHLHVEVPR